LRDDSTLERLHRRTTRGGRTGPPPQLAILAFDHRTQLEELADRHGAGGERIADFKALVARAAAHGWSVGKALHSHGATGTDSYPRSGVIVDGRHGEAELNRLTGGGLWIGRPVEEPGSRPLAFEEGDNVGLALRTWPREHVVKCLLSHHPDDDGALAREQLTRVMALADACDATDHELLLELIPPNWEATGRADLLLRGVEQVYAHGIRPHWWKLPPPDAAAWPALAASIDHHDPHCQGVLLLGLQASAETLWHGFRAAAGQPLCRGFAVGRTLFADAASGWFAGTLDDSALVAEVATRYQRLIALWLDAQRSAAPASTTSSTLQEIHP
jgi:5-dehydro-2-deoxygluconokinase